MNVAKIFNCTLATMLFTGLLAATLPGFFNPDMSPFQAYVVAPVLMQLAAMISAALHHVLELGEQHIHPAHHPGSNRTNEDQAYSMENMSSRRTGPSGNKTDGPSQDTHHGQRAA